MSSGLILGANLLCVTAVFLLVITSKRKVGHYFNPVTIYLGFWFVYLLIPVLFDAKFELNPAAYLYISLFLVIFQLPIYLYRWRLIFKKFHSHTYEINYSSFRFYRIILVGLSLGSVVLNYIDLLFQGISVDLDNLLSIGGQYASSRYNEDLLVSRYGQISLICAYQAALIGGLVCGVDRFGNKKNLFFVLSIVPSLFVMLFQSAKGLLFLNAALFFGAYFLMRMFFGSAASQRVSWLKIFLGFMLVALAVVASFISRFDVSAEFFDILDYLIISLSSYSAGHMFAFSDWFASVYLGFESKVSYGPESLTLGFYTFMSLFQLFGDNRFVPLGTYAEYPAFDNGIVTNIFTFYRGLLVDFGLLGSFVFAFLMGNFVVFSFRQFLLSRRLLFSASVVIFFVGFAYQSFLISSLTWPSIPFNFFVFLFIIIVLPPVRVQ